MKTIKNNKGFLFLEILLVAAVIGLLAHGFDVKIVDKTKKKPCNETVIIVEKDNHKHPVPGGRH